MEGLMARSQGRMSGSPQASICTVTAAVKPPSQSGISVTVSAYVTV